MRGENVDPSWQLAMSVSNDREHFLWQGLCMSGERTVKNDVPLLEHLDAALDVFLQFSKTEDNGIEVNVICFECHFCIKLISMSKQSGNYSKNTKSISYWMTKLHLTSFQLLEVEGDNGKVEQMSLEKTFFFAVGAYSCRTNADEVKKIRSNT